MIHQESRQGRSRSRLGLRGRIIVMLLPALLPLLLIVGLTYRSMRNSAVDASRNLSRLIIHNGVREANSFLTQQRSRFEEWVREDVFGLAIEFNTTNEMYARFREMLAGAPAFPLLVLTDRDGRVLVAGVGGEEARNLEGRAAAEAARLGDGCSALLTGSELLAAAGLPAHDTFVFGFRCKDSSGKQNGALLAYLDWSQVEQRVREVRETFVGNALPGAQVAVLDHAASRLLAYAAADGHQRTEKLDENLRRWLGDAANAQEVTLATVDGRRQFVTFAPLRDAAHLSRAQESEIAVSSLVLAAFVPEGDVLSVARSALYLSLGMAGAGAAVLLLLVWFASTRVARPINAIVRELRESADRVTGASGQVSGTSRTLAESASQQASSLEETGAALEQMAAMTRTNAENARQARQLAHQAREAAQSGDATMARLNVAMTGINESSGKISKIIKVIEEIAFQTNLLALNAAVEAARAGEHGRGFAVVAEEVRNLAQRAAAAAGETTSLIEESVHRAQEGGNVAAEVTEALGRIVSDITTASELVKGIATASDEQAQGVEQINTAVGQLDRITQSNAAEAEKAASAAEELATQAAAVNQVVGALDSVVRGAAAAKYAVAQPTARPSGIAATGPGGDEDHEPPSDSRR